MSERDLIMWTVSDHPNDYPDNFVAREWLVSTDGRKATGNMMLSTDLDLIRVDLRRLGLVQIARNPEDDPVIVETWI